MLNAGVFFRSDKHRSSLTDWVNYPVDSYITYKSVDRPLIAQIAGDDIQSLLGAGLLLQDDVTAIDLNLGCPQHIAKRGNYGAYLLPQHDKVCSIVKALAEQLDCPITVKIRKLDRDEDTLRLCSDLEQCGASALAFHGRLKEQKKQFVGAADWGIIKEVKAAVSIPVVANGGIESLSDAMRCVSATGADGVMSSEGILENPYLFAGDAFMNDCAIADRQLYVASEYIKLVHEFAGMKGISDSYLIGLMSSVKGHLFKILFRFFSAPLCSDLRSKLGKSHRFEEIEAIFNELERRFRLHGGSKNVREEDVAAFAAAFGETSWYRRHPRTMM